MDKKYISVNEYLRNEYGEKVYKLALDGGFTCPNRDGTVGKGGCIFCSEGGSGDFAVKCEPGNVAAQIEAAKEKIASKTNCNKFIAYFQAYSGTYGDIEYLEKLFTEAINHPQVVILSVATRCDCLDEKVMALLEKINRIKPVWIEMGLQTVHDSTHRLLNTCYTYDMFSSKVYELNKRGIYVIAHLILGLPGEDESMILESVRKTCNLPIDGIKLQLLHVLKGTSLAQMYEEEPFHVMELEEYCSLVAKCIELIPQRITVHRLTGDGPADILIAPRWSTDKKRVMNEIKRITCM